MTDISGINFKGKIIDAHAHIGRWYEDDDDPVKCHLKNYMPEDIFVHSNSLKDDTVSDIVFSNLDCFTRNMETGEYFEDEIQGNEISVKANKKYPELLPLISCQPNGGSADKIRFLLQKYPDTFVGLKFHPARTKLPPTAQQYDEYLSVAKEYNLPCVFHTTVKNRPENLQYSLPEMIYSAAKKIKDVPVIMAHLGVGNHQRAIDTMVKSIDNDDANLYCDLSWVDINDENKKTIINLIKMLKSKNRTEKILWGSDAPITAFDKDKTLYNKTVSDIKSAIQKEFGSDSEEIINQVFYKNSENIFKKGKSGTID